MFQRTILPPSSGLKNKSDKEKQQAKKTTHINTQDYIGWEGT
jgi:hypothetical protein